MAEVHQLIVRHGIEEARRQAVSKHERQVVEAAYQVLSEDAEKMVSPTPDLPLPRFPISRRRPVSGGARGTT